MLEKFFVKFRDFLFLFMILLVWLGIYSFYKMPKESSPAINIPFFSITAIYPWADPKNVEQQVIQKIENKLPSVNNLTSFKSISANNVWVITTEFARGTDKNTAYNDLKSVLDDVKTDLPPEVTVKLKKIDLVNIPVYTFSIVWKYYPSVLYDKIRFLEDDIKKIPGVDHVDVIWSYIPEIQIRFNYAKLKKYKLSLTNIVWIISSYIEKKPVDKKELNGLLYSFEVRTYEISWWNLIQKLENIKKQVSNIPLLYHSGAILRLKDIADVIVTHPFYKKLSYVDGKSAITYMVYKTSDTDILNLVKRIKSYLKTKERFFKDNNLQQVEVFSRTLEVRRTFDNFVNNFRQTALIILFVIALFIWLRQAVGVFLAFPLVYLITFIFLNSIWYTFNSIVSFSLILTLWIMVDNLIVIIEWFDEWIKHWLDRLQAIDYSIKTYRKSLLAGNLTTIAMFFPLNFMLTWKIWEFMKYLPTTVDSTLIFSMLVSFIFLPIILLYLYSDKTKIKVKSSNECKICNYFLLLVKFSLKRPVLTIFLFWLIFIVSLISFIKFGRIDFLPATDKNNIYVNIQYDKSVNLTENRKLTYKIYKYTKEFFDKCKWLSGQKCDKVVKHIQINIWQKKTFSPLDSVIYYKWFNPDLSYLNIILTDTDSRPERDNAIKIYPALNKYLSSKISEFNWKIKQLDVFIQKNGPSGWKDVSFNISVKTWWNNEMLALVKAYKKILPKLKQIPGTYGRSSSLEYSNWKIDILYDMDKVSQLKVNLRDVNLFLLSFYNKNWDYNGDWIKVSNISDVYKDIIPVTAYTIFSDSWFNLHSLIIPGTNVYLSSIVKKIVLKPEIKYYRHLDWRLVLKIEAYKKPGFSLWPITKKINEIIWKEKNITLTYASDVKDMKKSMKDLWFAFLVWIFLMFMVLVLNFENYKQSLIVFSIIPLLFVGAFLFLMLFNLPFGFPAQLGMFGLIWVWVNNAILLIDRYNALQVNSEKWTMINKWVVNSEKWIVIENWKIGGNEKLDFEQASETSFQSSGNHQLKSSDISLLLEVVKSRLMPVFLTTLTTVLGLITLAVKDALWGSLALSFMGWLILGTFITLIYIPVMLKVSNKSIING